MKKQLTKQDVAIFSDSAAFALYAFILSEFVFSSGGTGGILALFVHGK
jgi:hypothetical protein